MNTLVKAIVLSLTTTLVAAPAIAAPQDHNPQQHSQHPNNHNTQQPTKPIVKNSHNDVKKSANPSHNWKVGQKLPSQYHGQSYQVDHNQHKKLSKPGKNQQWIKVNGNYVLINVLNHNILKIVAN
ncbi:hypothetical protein B9T25_08575 [Acinetobacter sp. ANC 4470]|uniref:RcnB family protein n=1 Tax=Acinetobacter sp. ANC 4470 TaxID=1977881 RepID=UPI000A336AC0|nr:RcnB family protein [Acinetobacter sp. ANC 4470]OTG66829.1 hypothetical protein B9T25_08575 [Acinetobacter sp. ANC 4470]